MKMDSRYTALATPPQGATKPIDFGKLRGKNDINPQWRYEALTEQFGLCGIGWRFEVVSCQQVPVPATQEVMVYVQVNLYIKDGDKWSEPIPGMGGDFVIQKDKNGLHGNDEAYKMAVTDALGTAAKMIGVAADVYRGKYDTKYSRQQAEDPARQQAKAQQQAQQQAPAQTPPPKQPTIQQQTAEMLRNFGSEANRAGIDNGLIGQVIKYKYNKTGKELTMAEASELVNNFAKFRDEMLKEGAA
jgi:hypothetical protein